MKREILDMPPSQNPNTGRSVSIATKAPPELLKAVLEVIERGQSPYDSVSAFVRAAIHRFVLEVSRDTDSSLLPPIITLLKEWSRRHFEFACHEQVIEGMKNNAKMLEVYVEYNDVDRAAETLEDIATDILSLTDPFWKRVCLKEFFKFKSAKDAVRLVGDRGPKAIVAYEMWAEKQREE